MFTKTARQEFDAAVARYALHGADAAAKFIFAADLTVERITTSPFLFSQTFAGCRYARIDGFPYTIIYCYVQPKLKIVAFAHIHRQPNWARK